LDALRALAVLLVLLDHSELSTLWGIAVVDGGLGVEMFFVLSGFLITWLLLSENEHHGHIGLLSFYRHRIARLMPALLAYLCAGLLLLLAQDKPVPWGAVVSSAFYVINYYQALTGAQTHYLAHCWSLAIEEQFYLLWPLILIVLLRRHEPLVPVLALAIGALWILKAFLIIDSGASDAYVYRSLETRTDQLAMGCLLAAMLKSASWRHGFEALARHRWVLWTVGTGLLLSTMFLRHSMVEKYLFGYTIEPLLVAMLLPLVILEAQGTHVLARLLNAAPLVLIGQISYGIYLYHPLVMHPVRRVTESWSGSASLGILASILAVIGLAYLSFRFFEQPLRQRLRGH
jgi:peptidoglycan/LPS O-acetylase OafA/YrhL